MIVERMANFADGVTQGLGAALARSPGFVEQRFASNQLAGRLPKAQ
jgi:hypothetical protein